MLIKRRPLYDTTFFSDTTPKVLQKIYASRGVTNEEDLSLSLNKLIHFNALLGIEKAVALLLDAFEQQERIMIVGDFDADGATSTALLVLALRDFGYHSVDYLVPNRFDDGYGLTPSIVDQIRHKNIDLLITVDNGMSSIEGVAYAKQLGLKVLITDHHLASAQLPDADAIVNPNLPHCLFPSKALAGVGVAFYLMIALRDARRQKSSTPQPNIAQYLDLVAFGTIADVVPLDYNNRILVHQGLQRIKAGQCRHGILSLLEVSKKNHKLISSQDLGFSLGPRLNAAGRLDKMSYGVDLLLTNDPSKALKMAQELDELNQTRKEIESEMKQEALIYCQTVIDKQSHIPNAFTLFQADWHQGIIGIIASRIKDQFHRPTIAFANSTAQVDGIDMLKGSGRSIHGFHLRDSIDRINLAHPNLIVKFGGHAMAAGLTINASQIKLFSQLFEQDVTEHIEEEVLTNSITTDGELPINELSLSTAEIIENGGPWGQQFPLPLFDGVFKIIQQRMIGEKHLKLSLMPVTKREETVIQSPIVIDAIAFNAHLNGDWPDLAVKEVKIAYHLDINLYREQRLLQLLIQKIEKC